MRTGLPSLPSVVLHSVSVLELLEAVSNPEGVGAFLQPEAIHVWTIRNESSATSAEVAELLSADEKKRSLRMVAPNLKQRFSAFRASLRCLLALYTGENPQQLVFSYNSAGKPRLDDRSLNFNISHSDELAVATVSRTFELGVDVERLKPIPEALEIAESYFSGLEAQWIAEAEGDERSKRFLRCWVIREACVKALGVGLSLPLKSFEVCLPEMLSRSRLKNMDARPLLLRDGRVDNLLVREFMPEDGFLGALAVLNEQSGPLSMMSYRQGLDLL